MVKFVRRCIKAGFLPGCVFLMLIAAQDEADSEPVVEQIARQVEVLAAYEVFLTEQTFVDTDGFTLIYLDQDDIPELVVIRDWRFVPLATVDIYTYDQGETVSVGTYERHGPTVYCEKEGIIIDSNNYMEACKWVDNIHQVVGKEDTLVQTFQEQYGGDETIYTVDGKEVPEEQYEESRENWYYGCVKSLAYDQCTPIEKWKIRELLRDELQTLITTQYDTLKRNVLIKAGVEEDDILLMDYADYDDDGLYEAFVFCGESIDVLGETKYRGDFWFVGADRCIRLPEQFGCADYRKIDGHMSFNTGQKHDQRYLYYESDDYVSGIWTLYGDPVAVKLPQSGQVVYRGDYWGFELWVDGDNHYYAPDRELWTGHTCIPYFYHYSGEYALWPDEGEELSRDELAELCGFDLAGEVEEEGYEVTAIVRWQPSDIVTINYTIPIDEDGFISYENIIWDCRTKDYWRSEERGVTSWRDAGVGGSI